MTNGGRRTALRARMARSNPSSAQYRPELTGGRAPTGKAKTPPGRSARCTPANSAGRSAGRKWPSAPKLTARANAPAKGSARAEVDARDPPPAQRLENPHPRPGAAADVESRIERAEWAQRLCGRVEHTVRSAERRPVELRRQQVAAALDRGQRLHRS